MFGGLEIKEKTPERKKDETPCEQPPAASSGFSFLNASAPAPAPPPTSGFSFLNAGPPSSAEEPAVSGPVPAPPAASAASAFSFMTISAPVPAPEPDDPPAPAATIEVPASTTSSFSFVQSGGSELPPLASETAAGQEALASFGFIGGTSGADTVSTLSRDSPADFSLTGLGSLSTSTPMAVAGAGITFGGAAAAKPKPKKKRTRTAKIGVAANAAAALPDPMPPRPPTTTASRTRTESHDSATEALEAARRAEEFMSEKLKQQAAATTMPDELKSPAPAPRLGFKPVEGDRDDDDDEDAVLKKAMAAAEEARQLEKSHSISGRMGMGLGGLFRTRASPPGSNHSSSALNAAAAAASATSSRPPAPPLSNEPEESPADRLHREQEEAKRAMAERHLKMLQEEKEEEPSYTGSFQPPAPPTFQPAKPVAVITVPPFKRVDPPPVRQIAVPKPKTATDIFEDMLRAFRNKVVVSMNEVMRLRQHRSGLLEERFVTLAKERLAIQQKAQAEAQQMAAAEAEDFELADRMGTVIEGHERERLEFAAILENIGRALKELDVQKEQLVEGVTKCFQEIQSKLKEFKQKQESEDTEDATEAMKRFSVVSKQLSAENERLQHDLKHLDRDAELVAEERKELEVAISEQSGQFEVLRDKAKARLREVEDEIEELRKQLMAKQKQAAELRTEAAGHDESILKVRVKFSRQLTRVHMKESTMKDSREEWEIEKKHYEEQRQEHEAKMKEHSEALLVRDKLLEALHEEVDMAETFQEIVAKEIGFGIQADDKDEANGDLAQLQADVVKCEATVSEAKEILKVAAAAYAELEEEVKTLEFRIPILEDTKKECAARRDFKGAGRASKEIKEAQARLKECQVGLLEEAKQRQSAAEDEVKKAELVLEEKRKIAQEQDRESSLEAMQRLADNIKRLIATKASVCGNTKENSIQGVGAYVLESQIKALKMEGQTYGEKYGGWDELMAEIGVQIDEPEPSTPTETVEPAAHESAKAPEEAAKSTSSPTDAVDRKEKLSMFRELTVRLKETEDALETAAAEEDFEKAAELDEVLQKLLVEVESLSLTDEEMEAALAEPEEPAAADPVEEAPPDNVAEEAEPESETEPEPDAEAEVEPELEPADEPEVEPEPEPQPEAADPEEEGADEAVEDGGAVDEQAIEDAVPEPDAVDEKKEADIVAEQAPRENGDHKEIVENGDTVEEEATPIAEEEQDEEDI